MKKNGRRFLAARLGCVLAAVWAGAAGGAILAFDTNTFARTEGSGAVTNSFAVTGFAPPVHFGFRYVGPDDYLSDDATFEIEFSFDGPGQGGVGLWFGNTVASTRWLFLNDQTDGSGTAQDSQLRSFNGRNVSNHTGGTATLLDTIGVPDRLAEDTVYRMVVGRTNGAQVDVGIEVFRGTNLLANGSVLNIGTATNWGVTIFANNAGQSANTTTTTILSLEAIPEPSSLVLGLMGGAALLAVRAARGLLRRI